MNFHLSNKFDFDSSPGSIHLFQGFSTSWYSVIAFCSSRHSRSCSPSSFFSVGSSKSDFWKGGQDDDYIYKTSQHINSNRISAFPCNLSVNQWPSFIIRSFISSNLYALEAQSMLLEIIKLESFSISISNVNFVPTSSTASSLVIASAPPPTVLGG